MGEMKWVHETQWEEAVEPDLAKCGVLESTDAFLQDIHGPPASL